MLVHRLRRWFNINTTSGECLVRAGLGLTMLLAASLQTWRAISDHGISIFLGDTATKCPEDINQTTFTVM